jgi:hypothetical protein
MEPRLPTLAFLFAAAASLAACGDDPVLSSGADLALPDGTWTSIASMPTGRSGHTATRVGERIIVAGGLEADGDDVAVTTHVHAYDPVADSWELIGELQQARDAHQAVLLDDDRILFYGSFLGGVPAEVYDVTTGTSTLTTGDPPLFHPKLAPLVGGSTLLVGGSLDADQDNETAQVWFLDRVELAWRELDPLERPLDHATLARLVDGRVALAGEQSFLGNDPELRVLLFDPQSELWSDARPANTINSLHQGRAIALTDLRLMLLGFEDTVGGSEPRIEILGSTGGDDTELWADVTPEGVASMFGEPDSNPGDYIPLTGSLVARVVGGPAIDGAPLVEITRFAPIIGEVITSEGGPRALAGRAVVGHPDGSTLVLGGNAGYVDSRSE